MKHKHEYGINGALLTYLVDYLQNRQQCVVIGVHQSEHMPVAPGVPQGSILGLYYDGVLVGYIPW